MKTKLLVFVTLCLWVLTGWGQSRVTEGRVTSAADNEPVMGAAVKVKGTQTGVVTDLDGRFSVETQAGATLEISFIGIGV